MLNWYFYSLISHSPFLCPETMSTRHRIRWTPKIMTRDTLPQAHLLFICQFFLVVILLRNVESNGAPASFRVENALLPVRVETSAAIFLKDATVQRAAALRHAPVFQCTWNATPVFAGAVKILPCAKIHPFNTVGARFLQAFLRGFRACLLGNPISLAGACLQRSLLSKARLLQNILEK